MPDKIHVPTSMPMHIRMSTASIASSTPFMAPSSTSSKLLPRYMAIAPAMAHPATMGIWGSEPSPTTHPNMTAASKPKASIP